MRKCASLLALSCGVLTLAGCAGKGEVIQLELDVPKATSPVASARGAQGLTVAVTPFEDVRSERDQLGTRTNFWGTEHPFGLTGDPAEEITAKLIANFLNSKGWKAELVKQSDAQPQADVVLSGKVQDLSVNATGGWFSTDMRATSKVLVEGLNTADGSTVRMALSGSGSQGVFWFEDEDAEILLQSVLAESFQKLITATKVENGLLRLK